MDHDLTDEQLHEIGQAVGNVERAIGETPEAFDYLADHAHVVGEMVVFALARKGFVVTADAARAALIAAEFERAPEQGARLS